MRTRRQKINEVLKILSGNNDPRVTQKHCDLINKYRDRDNPHYTPEHFEDPEPIIFMYWRGEEKRDQFFKELETLPPLPKDMKIISLIRTTVK
jgi:hypothetical protein